MIWLVLLGCGDPAPPVYEVSSNQLRHNCYQSRDLADCMTLAGRNESPDRVTAALAVACTENYKDACERYVKMHAYEPLYALNVATIQCKTRGELCQYVIDLEPLYPQYAEVFDVAVPVARQKLEEQRREADKADP